MTQMHSPHPQQVPPRRRKRWPWVVGGLVVAFVVIGSIGTAGGGGQETQTVKSAPATSVATSTPPPEEPAGPATSFSDGTYVVGEDIEPGDYKTEGPDPDAFFPNCYWARLKDTSGGLESIIANSNVQGPTTVTVKESDYAFEVRGCDWVKK